MVETVSAQTPALGQGASVAAMRLEPGTELKARVEANLPGGIVRLATDDAKFDLKLPVRLPPGSDVIVSVSGNRSNPVIQVTTPQVLPGEPAPQVTAQQPQQAPPPSQAPPDRPASGLLRPPAASGAVVPAATHETQSAQGARAVPVASARSQTSVQGAPAHQGADLRGAPVQQAAGPARQPGPPAASTSQVTPAAARGEVKGARPEPAVTAARPLSVANANANANASASASAGSPPPPVAGKPGAGTPAPANAPVQGNAVSGSPAAAPARALTSVSNQTQTPAAPLQSSAPATGSTPATPVPQANPQPAGYGVRQVPLPASANPVPATASAPPQPGEAVPRPATPVPRTDTVPGAKAQTIQQSPLQPAGLPSATTGTTAAPASATTGFIPNGTQTPQAPSSPLSSPVAPQSAEPARSAAGSPLPGPGKPSPVPALLSTTGVSAVKSGAATAVTAPSPQGSPANTATAAASAPAAPAPQSKGPAHIGESLRVAQNQPYQTTNAGAVHRTAGPSPANVTTEANPAGQLARQAFQALGEQQSGLGNLFAHVGNLMSAQATGKVSLPDPVVKAMQQILGLRLTPGQNLSAGDIQQSIRMSGQFREANAAFPRGTTPGPQADLKSVLMSFRSLLQQFGAETQVTRPAGQPNPPSRQEPPQAQTQPGGRGFLPGSTPQILQAILKETDAALARVRMTQLVNTGLAGDDRAQATSRPMDHVFELPLALGQETGILQLQVGRDGSGQGEEGDNEPAWRLRFAMDLTATGPVEAAVSLRGGGTYVSLWVERSATFDGLKALEETMLASFADAGLDLQEFRLMRGLPPKAAARYGTLVDRQS